LGCGHDGKANDINRGARNHRDTQAEAIRDRPNRGLRQAPDNVLHRDGQREISGRQRQVLRDWRKEQPKALAYSHARLSNNTAVPIKISRVWLLPATTVRGIPGAIPHLILTVV
jgi:hypothetical protein